MLAGGITYSALFSVFAALAIGYTVFMAVLGNNEELRSSVLSSVNSALPGIIDTGDNGGLVDPDDLVMSTSLNSTSIIAAIVLLWTAMSVMTGLRRATRAMFGIVTPKENFALAKGRDLLAFLVLALAVVLTAALSIAAGTAGSAVMTTIGVSGALAEWSLRILGLLAALIVDVAVIALLIRTLAGVHAPRRDLLLGALVGGVASGVLRVGGTSLVGSADNPVLASAAAIVTLLLWINLLARVFLMVSAWTANPPAPPKPRAPEDTRFERYPNYVTLSVPETLDWPYQPTTGAVEPLAEFQQAAKAADLRQLGAAGAEMREEMAHRERSQWLASRRHAEQEQREEYWGGIIGAIAGWWRRARWQRLEQRYVRQQAYRQRDEQRRKVRSGH